MPTKDYYLLEPDDAVAALQSKDEQIEELCSILKECKEAYQAYIPLFLMLKNKDAADYANKLLNRINEVLDN